MTLEERAIVESIKDPDLQALTAMVGMQGNLLRVVVREGAAFIILTIIVVAILVVFFMGPTL